MILKYSTTSDDSLISIIDKNQMLNEIKGKKTQLNNKWVTPFQLEYALALNAPYEIRVEDGYEAYTIYTNKKELSV